jgi:hypothetical protein
LLRRISAGATTSTARPDRGHQAPGARLGHQHHRRRARAHRLTCATASGREFHCCPRTSSIGSERCTETEAVAPTDPVGYPDAPNHYGLLWWNNADGTLPAVPRDAYWAWGRATICSSWCEPRSRRGARRRRLVYRVERRLHPARAVPRSDRRGHAGHAGRELLAGAALACSRSQCSPSAPAAGFRRATRLNPPRARALQRSQTSEVSRLAHAESECRSGFSRSIKVHGRGLDESVCTRRFRPRRLRPRCWRIDLREAGARDRRLGRAGRGDGAGAGSKGARVVITAATSARARRSHAGSGSRQARRDRVAELELGSRASIRTLPSVPGASRAADLVNNAGVMACPFGGRPMDSSSSSAPTTSATS